MTTCSINSHCDDEDCQCHTRCLDPFCMHCLRMMAREAQLEMEAQLERHQLIRA
jgi:hypothetical protein